MQSDKVLISALEVFAYFGGSQFVLESGVSDFFYGQDIANGTKVWVSMMLPANFNMFNVLRVERTDSDLYTMHFMRKVFDFRTGEINMVYERKFHSLYGVQLPILFKFATGFRNI